MDAGDSDWLTWPQAANVADCPVPTIDRYSRQGLIKKRPHRGSRPTLSRASVEEFAEWWRAHQEERERKRAAEAVLVQKRAELRERARRLGVKPSRVPPLDDEVTGWVTTDEAGAILGLSRQHTIRVVRDAGLTAIKLGPRWWVDEPAVRALAENRARWILFNSAAELVGCSTKTIARAVQDGRIGQREVESTRSRRLSARLSSGSRGSGRSGDEPRSDARQRRERLARPMMAMYGWMPRQQQSSLKSVHLGPGSLLEVSGCSTWLRRNHHRLSRSVPSRSLQRERLSSAWA